MWWVRANPRFQDQSPDLHHTHLTCQIEKGKGSHLFSTLMKLLLHLGEWGGGRLPPHSGAPQSVTRGEQHHTYWWTADTPVPQEPPWPNLWGLTPGVGGGVGALRGALCWFGAQGLRGYMLSVSALNGGDPKAQTSISGSVLSLL